MDLVPFLLFAGLALTSAPPKLETDSFPTSQGELTIAFIGHGTLMFRFAGKVIHVDPYGKLADYEKLPKADLILLTHHHPDHLDPAAIRAIRTEQTRLVCSAACAKQIRDGIVLNNGDRRTVDGIPLEAVPAYNLVHRRDDNQPYHPKGEGNGYLLDFGERRVYVAGDTENTPEMKALTGIDIAFLPMNLPYTMTPEMVADAARAFRPRILYPYHYGDTDISRLVRLLRDAPGVELRVRPMQ